MLERLTRADWSGGVVVQARTVTLTVESIRKLEVFGFHVRATFR